MLYTHAAAALLALVLGFGSAWQIQNWRHGALEAERLELAAQDAARRVKQADAAAESHETVRAQLRTEFQTIYRDIDRVVEKPVYRSVCLDDDGMRALAAAIGRPAGAAAEPAPAVPGPDDPH